jgi:hypothetical protein
MSNYSWLNGSFLVTNSSSHYTQENLMTGRTTGNTTESEADHHENGLIYKNRK